MNRRVVAASAAILVMAVALLRLSTAGEACVPAGAACSGIGASGSPVTAADVESQAVPLTSPASLGPTTGPATPGPLGPPTAEPARPSAPPTAAPSSRPSRAPIPTPSPTPRASAAPLLLTFQDNFGGLGLRSVWGTHWPGFGSADWSRTQSKVEDGVLKITATTVGTRWRSDLLDTVGTFEQRYGVFEARINYPLGAGLWPAFWLAQPPNPKHQLAEADIIEACAGPAGTNSGNNSTVINLYVHGLDGRSAFAARRIPVSNATGRWHDYKLVWRPDRMVFSRDGVVLARVTNPAEIPDVKMAIVVNLAGGGTFCGPPGPSTPKNATMEVDWIRAWR